MIFSWSFSGLGLPILFCHYKQTKLKALKLNSRFIHCLLKASPGYPSLRLWEKQIFFHNLYSHYTTFYLLCVGKKREGKKIRILAAFAKNANSSRARYKYIFHSCFLIRYLSFLYLFIPFLPFPFHLQGLISATKRLGYIWVSNLNDSASWVLCDVFGGW